MRPESGFSAKIGAMALRADTAIVMTEAVLGTSWFGISELILRLLNGRDTAGRNSG
jgi:hypothetical protein